MHQLSAIIVDDEQKNVDALANLVKLCCPQLQLLGFANNILDAEKLISSLDPEIVFLDIEMPMGNGFQLLERFKKINFQVIFVTAFNQYAVQAFKFSAIDYLLKPVDADELIVAIEKAQEKIVANNMEQRVQALLSNIRTEAVGKKKISIATADSIFFEEIDNIIHLESVGNYSTIYLKNGKAETVTKQLHEFETLLPETIFCRVHKSHIININYIKKYFRGRGGYVILENDAKVEISQRKRDEFLAMIQ